MVFGILSGLQKNFALCISDYLPAWQDKIRVVKICVCQKSKIKILFVNLMNDANRQK